MAKTAVRALGLLAAGLLAVVLAYRAGPPAGSLPDSALGWELLLYVERAAALLAIVGATALIAVRAAGGMFPRIFGPVEYELARPRPTRQRQSARSRSSGFAASRSSLVSVTWISFEILKKG